MSEFVLKKNHEFKATVLIITPEGLEQKFEGKFLAKKNSEIQILVQNKSDENFIKEVLIGWEGVVDETGEAIPFSVETLAQISDFAWVSQAIIKTYTDSLLQVTAKN